MKIGIVISFVIIQFGPNSFIHCLQPLAKRHCLTNDRRKKNKKRHKAEFKIDHEISRLHLPQDG